MLAEQLPNVAVLVFDLKLCLLVAVGEALTRYGLSNVAAEGRPLKEVVTSKVYDDLDELLQKVLDGRQHSLEQQSMDGERWFQVFGKPLKQEDGKVWAGLVLAQDVTELRNRENELRREKERLAVLAYHDDLTSLANRALFRDRVEHALARTERDGGEVAVAFVDLDRFKRINDTLGHDAGDQVLQAVAGILRATTRAADTVARLGGDEFGIMVEGLQNTDDVFRTVARIQAAFEEPVTIAGHSITIPVSVGVASGPRDGTTARELLAAADRAMYLAKITGRSSDPPAPKPDLPIRGVD